MKKVPLTPAQGKLLMYSATAAMVTCAQDDRQNIITITYIAPVATQPIAAIISVNKHRYSYDMLMNGGDFVINLPGPELAFETQFCGRRSGRDYDKFKEMKLTPVPAQMVKSPLIEECWGHVECKLINTFDIGSHTIFLGEIVAASAINEYFDKHVVLGEGKAQILQFLGGKTYGILERSIDVPLDREE